MAKIENHKYSVEEAFRDCFYIVPDYQREYVWQDKEVQQLLDDIDEQIDGRANREYFIGMVLVSPSSQKTTFEVIDGQQRLTTFFLLLCTLKKLFHGEPQYQTISGLISASYTSNQGETKTSLKLEPRYENAGEVMAKIVAMEDEPQATRNGIEASGIASFGSLENLLNAYSTIYAHLLKKHADKAALKKYWGYLANNVVFIQISTDLGNALKIFETINERGVGLNSMDLLKNLLFTNVEAEEFGRLKTDWKKITKPLEKAKQKPLRFLRYFLMASYKIQNDRSDYIVREDEIYDWLTKKENAADCEYEEKPFQFVRKIIESVDHYLAFNKGDGNDGRDNVAMKNLGLLCGPAFSLHFVLLLAASNFPKALFDHLVAQLESFLFYYIFTKTPTKELERNFSVWADELREIGNEKNKKAQKEKLNAFINTRFQKSMSAKAADLTDSMKRYSLGSMQKYRTRYLLAKISQHVDMAYKGIKTERSLEDYIELQIEHILPDKPKKAFATEFAEKYPGLDYNLIKNKLGNLTLLEKPINIVIGNDFFEIKKPEYAKCKCYLTSSIAGITKVGKNTSTTRINEKLLSFDNWTPEEIDRRQTMLIGLVKDIWKLSDLEVA